MFEIVLNK